MKKLVMGIIIGSTLTFSASVLAEPIKQYILTKIDYPIVVDGSEYKSDNLPFLNYEGSTYIPLRSIADILGVEYKWHDDARIVEITKPKPQIIVKESNPPQQENKQDVLLNVGEKFTEGKFSMTLERAYLSGGVYTCYFKYENNEDKAVEAFTKANITYEKSDKTTDGSLWFYSNNATVYSYPSGGSGYLSFQASTNIEGKDLKPILVSLNGNGNKVFWKLQ